MVKTQPARVPMTASLAGRKSGLSRSWNVWGPMMFLIEKEPPMRAAAKARLVEPATLAAVHYAASARAPAIYFQWPRCGAQKDDKKARLGRMGPEKLTL